MKAKCLQCRWRGEVESPEIKSCPKCGGKVQHYVIDTSKKGVVDDGKKEKKE